MSSLGVWVNGESSSWGCLRCTLASPVTNQSHRVSEKKTRWKLLFSVFCLFNSSFFLFGIADGITANGTIAVGLCLHTSGCEILTVCFTSKTRVSAPLRAVRISGITRSNSAVGLIDARGLTTSHSRHILTGISYRQGLAQALLVPSKENKRRDIRALFQRRGPFCLCLISLREKWKEGQPISLAPTAEPGASAVKRRWSRVSAAQHSVTPTPTSLSLSMAHSLLLDLCSQEALQFWLQGNQISQHWGPFRPRGQRAKTERGRSGDGDEGEDVKSDFGTKLKERR